MATLNSDQQMLVYSDGACEKTALYSLKNITAGDTGDLLREFKVVKRAGIVSATGSTISSVTITGGTGYTIPAGPTQDGVWLLVVGVAS